MIIRPRNLIRILFFVTFIMLTASTAQGQTGSLSPYSRYGIGDLTPQGFTHQAGMGGIGAALSTPYNINHTNPASYIADSVIVFDFGGRGEIRRLERNSGSSTFNSASFSHFALAFPIVKGKISTTFGLLPYSSVGYDIIIEEDNVPDIGSVRYLFEGEGGFNKFFVGTGFRLTKNLSLGLNASYLFGTVDQIKSVEFPFSINYFNSRYINAVSAQGFYLNFGALYETKLKNEMVLTLGVTGSASSRINAINSQYFYNYVFSPQSGGNVVKDSVFNETETKGKITLPNNFIGGFTLGKPNNWLIGADVNYTDWERFENFNTGDSLKNTYSVHLGGEKFYKRLILRLGAKYGTTFLDIRNTQINEYGITFGFGIQKLFPKRPPSTINMAFELGQRGTTDNNLIKEQYIKFTLGFTFTDIWFIKPKYD